MALGHEGAGIAEVGTPIFLVFSTLSTPLMRDLQWDHRIMHDTNLLHIFIPSLE